MRCSARSPRSMYFQVSGYLPRMLNYPVLSVPFKRGYGISPRWTGGAIRSRPREGLNKSRRARRGFCGTSRKAQNPRQAWTACLVLQRRVTHPLGGCVRDAPYGPARPSGRAWPAKPRPRRGSAQSKRGGVCGPIGPDRRAHPAGCADGPFVHPIACVCLRAHDARCGRSNHPVFDSNAHGGTCSDLP
jgi:hypothetical protein